MADFNQAVKWMEQGKSVIRSSESYRYLELVNINFKFYFTHIDEPTCNQNIGLNEFQATDWVIYDKIVDTWDLANHGFKCPDCEREGSMKCIELHSFYQFIQYVKEDIKKESDDKISKIRILYLIDKRKGEF